MDESYLSERPALDDLTDSRIDDSFGEFPPSDEKH